MSRQTPRKGRHQQNASIGGGVRRGQQSQQNQQSNAPISADVSAVELDAGYGVAGGGAYGAETDLPESLTNMNLHVLRQYEPSVRSILSVAASTVVYVLNYETGGWEKPEPQIEGTLFLCEQEPLVVGEYALPRACVFVLNRKSLMNVVVDLAKVNMAEVTADLITLRIEDDGQSADIQDGPNMTPPVLGFWIHGGTSSNVSQFDPNIVMESWQYVRSSLERVLGTSDLAATGPVLEAAGTAASLEMTAAGHDPVGMATRAIGRRPSISELVAAALGPGGSGVGAIGA